MANKFMKGMLFMSDIINERDFISKRFDFLRVLQSEHLSKRNIEEVKRVLNASRSTADRIKQDLIDANVITSKLVINQKLATFIGISISYGEIELCVVGLDCKVIPWGNILPKTNFSHKEFNGKINFDYSSSGLINISTFINELIMAVQSILPVKAICFSFDNADLKNRTFSLVEYPKEDCAYSFDAFCLCYFGEMQKDTALFLERNTICGLVSNEFSMLRRSYNSLYFNIEPNGCFASVISFNTVHSGYNMQTLNLSGILDKNEKKALVKNDIADSELLSICIKILKALIVPLTPDLIYISGKTIHQNSKLLSLLSFQKAEIISLCMANNYNPEIKLLPNSLSKGTAIMAMYQYYG